MAALVLALGSFIGISSAAGAQDCVTASPSSAQCGPEVNASRVLSNAATAPAVAASAPTVAASAAENGASSLAFTGSDGARLALLGVGAIILGVVLRTRARARHTS
jgi:hypothetical protein